jgi:ABC-type transport system involved in multi-copper enzyme maturation permease subunit
MSATITPYEPAVEPRHNGFASLVRAEWTKFRTVRGWVIGLVVAGLVVVLAGLLAAGGSRRECAGPNGKACPASIPGPTGPDGEPVSDRFSFLHQSLVGNGSITVRVDSLAGVDPNRVEPWAKAGLIIKQNTRQGSPYAAVMLTGAHGIHMQYDFTQDRAGTNTARWLRLVRSGDTVTGYESPNGTQWTKVGSARLNGLPRTVPAGLFVTSPEHVSTTQGVGSFSTNGYGTTAAGVFDHVSRTGDWAQTGWHGSSVGEGPGVLGGPAGSGFSRHGGTFTIAGTGDIAPAAGGENTVEGSLTGTFAGLIVLIVLGAMFVTAEYRRGLIRTTLAASPHRGRVLAAKALVLGGVTFLVGLVASAVAFSVVNKLRRRHGITVLPVATSTEIRVVIGTAALLALSAVFALAAGAIFRRGAGAVVTAIVLLVLPYLLAVASLLPVGPAQWLLRLTPAAGFAIQQSLRQYAQVSAWYAPPNGYYPLSPWVGFAVLAAWTAFALGLAVVLIRRRDA